MCPATSSRPFVLVAALLLPALVLAQEGPSRSRVNLRAPQAGCSRATAETFTSQEGVDLDRACRGTLGFATAAEVQSRRPLLVKLGFSAGEIDTLAAWVEPLLAQQRFPTVFVQDDAAFGALEREVEASKGICSCQARTLLRQGRWTAESPSPNAGCHYSWLIGTIEPPLYCPNNTFSVLFFVSGGGILFSIGRFLRERRRRMRDALR